MFKVKYGEDYLTDYIRFIKVNRGAGTENDLSVEDNSGIGSKVIKTRRKAKEISMTFHVIDGLDVNVVREKLGKIISTTETKQLIFSDNPNFYYEAILTGTIEYTDDGFNADGGFTLLVPSGYAESVDTKVLNNDNSGGENGTIINNTDNSVSVLINNNGTLPIYPTIKVTPTSETGYLAFVGQNGILEIGNPDEADTTTAKSQKLVCDFKTRSDFETNFVPDTSWTTSWPTNLEGMPLNS
ncbi:distal tail protein Dit, partial [Lactococcus lactis]|uniref:distal tail protein Dit n=1 Tax=Lactococcus lactis TaxID=1358 RepID=UPI00223AB3DA